MSSVVTKEKKKRITLSSAWSDARELIWEHRYRLALGMSLMIVNRLAGLVLPTSSKYVIDEVIMKHRGELLVPLALAAGGATLVQALSSFALSQVLGVAAQRAITEMRKSVQEHVERLPIRYFDSTQTGVLISRIMTDAEGIRNLVGTGLVQLVGGLVTAAIALGVLFYLNWRLTSITLLALGAFGGAMALAFQKLRPLFRERGKINAEVTGRLTESLGGIRIVKAYAAEKREELVFARGAHRLFRNVARSMTAVSGVTAFSTVIVGAIGVNQINGQTEQIQYSAEEQESLRTRLLELVDTVKDFSRTLKPNDKQTLSNLSRARVQIEHYTPKQLNALRASLDPAKMNAGLENARAVLNDFKPSINAYYARNSQSAVTVTSTSMENSAAFPTVEPPDAVCEALVGAGRPSSALVIAADAVYMAAKIANVALSRGCEQVAVAVVLGEGGGGNTSLLCVVSDGVLLAAEVLRDKVESCDEDYSKRAIDASLARLEHVHTDLENSIANDNANTTTINGNVTTATTTITGNNNTNTNTIVANDNTNKNTIVTAIGNSQGAIVDNANGNTTALTTAISNTQTSIINNDNTNKNTIVTNNNANKDTIVANDNVNKNTIVANDNANAAALTNLLLRLQIEADLAAADSSSPVALFMTPSTTCGSSAPLNQCGLLNLVRQIVVQTISNLAGSNAAQANSYLAKGDTYKNAGNYASAYQQYRQAYKSAAK